MHDAARVLAHRGYRFVQVATRWEDAMRLARRRNRRHERSLALLQAGEQLAGYARHWATSRAADVSDAFVYDAAAAVLAAQFRKATSDAPRTTTTATPPRTPTLRDSSAATAERRMRNGAELPEHAFELPVTLEESVRVLHRFARRYANGRGLDTASAVNALTRELLALEVDLSETARRDGTLWATNGHGPGDDTLTEDQRREAEAALPERHQRRA